MDKPMPNIVLKRKRLNKKKNVIVFRRNNLSFSDFKHMENGYVYEEKFEHFKVQGVFKMYVDSEDLYDIFQIDEKGMRIRGGQNHFGVFLRFNDQKKLPLEKNGQIGCVRYVLKCDGESLYFDTGKKKDPYVSDIHDTSRKSGGNVSYSVRWAASHPLQGGGVSPR